MLGLEDKIGKIRDADLRAELEAARGGFLFAQIVEHILYRQRERDAAAAAEGDRTERRAGMARDQRRREAVREVIENAPTAPENLQHIHSVLALCGLPYRDPDPAREALREYGRTSLSLVAGRLKNPVTGQWEAQGLPYGPKARLVLLHLCTEAVRQKNPVIRVADTLSGFMREMGFAVTGGERGTIGAFKEQLNRLAACSMQIGFWDGADKASTLNVPPFRSLDLWRPQRGLPEGEGTAWQSSVAFHQDFFDSLIKHALPVDIRAARAFSGSSRKLDLLFWVGYRLRVLQRPLRLTWENLHRQFGADNASIRSFRQAFKADFAGLQEVFPRLPITLDERGMTLNPADPSALLVPPRPAGNRRKIAPLIDAADAGNRRGSRGTRTRERRPAEPRRNLIPGVPGRPAT